MGKLKGIGSRLKALPPRIGHALMDEKARDRYRVQHEPSRRWYRTARWQKLRIDIFKRDLFTCQMAGCGRVEGNTSLLVCDHKQPHKGDEALFWSPDNLQCMCKPCHDGEKQRQDRARQMGRGSESP